MPAIDTSSDHGTIQVYPNGEALSRAAAELVAARAAASHGAYAIALAGGETPRRTYELLAQPPWRERVPWARVHACWGDERCVPPSDPQSNQRLARRALLDHVPIAPDHIHPIACTGDPACAAADYETELRATFAGRPPRLDLVLLGLGSDGHTASLFPGSPALAENERWVAAVRAPNGSWRVTLTASLLNQAAAIAFLVAGAAKAAALGAVLQGLRDPQRWPAQLIRPREGELLWLADAEAAALLR